MEIDDYNNCPQIETFDGLKAKDKVYSPRFGLGTIERIYRDDELIVRFCDRKNRIALEDSDLRLVSNDSKRSSYPRITVNGKTMGRKKMIKYMRGEL